MTPDSSPTLLTRRTFEVLAALLVTAFGATIVWGAREFDIGWDDRGPGTGYFPFWVGTVVVIGGLGALIQGALRAADANLPALTLDQAKRALAFLLPLVGFLLVTSFLGLYVGMTLYLIVVMTLQGNYRLPAALAVGLGTAVFFYIVFEKVLKVGLMKGPLEAWLGIH